MRDISKLSEMELEVLEAIKTVIDPEVGINIVDMGLIYNVIVNEPENNIYVQMTLSARGCPVGDSIINQVEIVVQNYWPGFTVAVELTWEPQWTPDLMTEDGMAALNR